MITLYAGDVVDVPIKERNGQGEITDISNVRPAIILQSYPEKGVALAMKVTRSSTHSIYCRIPIQRWERAGLDEPSYAEVDTVDPITNAMAIRPRGVLHSEDFSKVLDAFHRFYSSE